MVWRLSKLGSVSVRPSISATEGSMGLSIYSVFRLRVSDRVEASDAIRIVTNF